MSSHSRGFTIVELLIVIVIIGILASLVIVSYRGSQQKATNLQSISVVSHYIKAILLYELANDKYPEPSAGAQSFSCLGNGYPGNICANVNGAPPANCGGFGTVASQPWFNDAVKPHLDNKTPTVSTQTIKCNAMDLRGAYYFSNWPNVGLNATVFYYLKGDVSCGSPNGLPLTRTLLTPTTTYCYLTLPQRV